MQKITTVILQVISWEMNFGEKKMKKEKLFVCCWIITQLCLSLTLTYYNTSSPKVDLCLTFMNYVQSQSFLGVHYSFESTPLQKK